MTFLYNAVLLAKSIPAGFLGKLLKWTKRTRARIAERKAAEEERRDGIRHKKANDIRDALLFFHASPEEFAWKRERETASSWGTLQ